MTTVGKVEWWVMKILLHRGPQVQRELALPEVQRMVSAGTLALHPDGHIMEPVEMFATQQEAEQHQDKVRRDDPDGDYRVILNADYPV